MMKRIIALMLLGLCLAGTAFAAEKNPTAVIETNVGNVKVELFQNEAPISVKNFLEYAKSGHYNGTVFHRVIANFMIQGGGLTQNMTPKPTKAPIKNEAANGLKNDRGTLAMARTGVVDSATSQFFICHAPQPHLDRKHTVFGQVTDGLDVVHKIRQNDVIKSIRVS